MKEDYLNIDFKGSSTWDKLLVGGSIATILGFFLPFFAGVGGMAIKLPYAWILFLFALAIPCVKLMMENSRLKRDILITFSELLFIVAIVGIFAMSKINGIIGAFSGDSVGILEMLSIGSVFLILGSILQFVGAIKQNY